MFLYNRIYIFDNYVFNCTVYDSRKYLPVYSFRTIGRIGVTGIWIVECHTSCCSHSRRATDERTAVWVVFVTVWRSIVHIQSRFDVPCENWFQTIYEINFHINILQLDYWELCKAYINIYLCYVKPIYSINVYICYIKPIYKDALCFVAGK